MRNFILYGKDNPNRLVNKLVEEASKAMYEFDENIYFDFSKTYLQAGKFPTLYLGGVVDYDFRDQMKTKSYRHDFETRIKYAVLNYFRSRFPLSRLNVVFQLTLVPVPESVFFSNNEFVETSYTPELNRNDLDKVREIEKALRISEDASEDFTALMFNDKLHVDMTFKNKDVDLEVWHKSTGKLLQSLVPEIAFESCTYSWNPTGSMVFFSRPAISGVGIDYLDGVIFLDEFVNPLGKSGRHPKHPLNHMGVSIQSGEIL